MAKLTCPKKILLVEAIGFALIILFLWLDEVFDLPNKLFGAQATPVNYPESWFETAIVLLFAVVVMFISASLALRLQRADTEKARLFGVIAHDLRSPFTNLIGNAELLRKNFAELSEEDRRALSAGIFDAADKAHDLLENLLCWAEVQLESGNVPFRRQELRTLVETVIEQVGLSATRKQIVIGNNVPEGMMVTVDETAVHSVLRNLLSNAIKFSHPGSSIEVGAKGRAGKVRVSVVDRGVGMSRREVKSLFHMGTRLSKPGTSGEAGSGLGLLLAHELVRRGGGKLKVRSDEGKGTVFHFTLPRAKAARSGKVAAVAEAEEE